MNFVGKNLKLERRRTIRGKRIKGKGINLIVSVMITCVTLLGLTVDYQEKEDRCTGEPKKRVQPTIVHVAVNIIKILADLKRIDGCYEND